MRAQKLQVWYRPFSKLGSCCVNGFVGPQVLDLRAGGLQAAQKQHHEARPFLGPGTELAAGSKFLLKEE
ncbi:hypothetical protein THAOC_08435, partial [Thalassiosira oceanica]